MLPRDSEGLGILDSTDMISAKGAGSGAGNADIDRDTGCDESVGYEVAPTAPTHK